MNRCEFSVVSPFGRAQRALATQVLGLGCVHNNKQDYKLRKVGAQFGRPSIGAARNRGQGTLGLLEGDPSCYHSTSCVTQFRPSRLLASPPASYLHDLTDLPKISFNPALTFIQDHMHQKRRLGFLEVLIKWRVVLLILGALLGGVAAYYGTQLDLDRSIEHMFADDDPILAPYQKLQKNFGENELVIAIYSDPELKTEAGKEKIKQLAEEAKTIPGVVSAVTVLDPPGASNFDDTNRGAKLRDVFAGYTHNQSLDAVGIVCLLSRPQEGDPPRRETLKQLRALTSTLPNGTLVRRTRSHRRSVRLA